MGEYHSFSVELGRFSVGTSSDIGTGRRPDTGEIRPAPASAQSLHRVSRKLGKAHLANVLFAVAASGAFYVAAVLMFIHFVRKDLNVVSSPISEYAIGAYGRWMTSALWVWCLAALVFAVGINLTAEPSAYVLLGTAALIAFSLSLATAAHFPMDVPFPPERLHPSSFSAAGLLHISGASVATLCFPVAAMVFSSGVATEEQLKQVRFIALPIAAVCSITTATFFVVSMVSIQYFGILQRIFVAADLLWICVVAIALIVA
jgi:hypothetical protein